MLSALLQDWSFCLAACRASPNAYFQRLPGDRLAAQSQHSLECLPTAFWAFHCCVPGERGVSVCFSSKQRVVGQGRQQHMLELL
jgi:hypothetical protein